MKIENIKTVEQAKALAFDCIQIIEQQQVNLRTLMGRIEELEQVKVRTLEKASELNKK